MRIGVHKLTAIVTWATIALLLLPASRPSSAESASADLPFAATNVLYEGSLNTGTPDTQEFFYLTQPLTGTQATQTFSSPSTLLDTTSQINDYAGYFANPLGYAPLDRVGGYQVLFTVQVISETHVNTDRAGFSLLVTSSDKQGIELGFWENEVWAQEGGTVNPFTHAEGASFTTTTDLVEYRLTVIGDHYSLAANGSTVLAGLLRDYTQAPAPPLPVNPYTTANLIFLGDDTSSAQATIKFRHAAVINAAPFEIHLPLISAD